MQPAMKSARRISFWRYNLFLEITTFGLAVFLLVLAVIFTLSEIRQRYLDRNVADAVQAALFLENYMSEAREVLSIFASLREDERTRTAINLMPAFSDLYRLDEALRVERVYKAVPASQVFSGYSFTAGKLADHLREHGDAKTLSDMMRGYEDNRASVYLSIDLEGQKVLGRLDLEQVQEFLTGSARISGRPMLLVTRQGFVMLSSDSELRVPVIDVARWERPPSLGETLTIGAKPWIPVLSDPMAVGSRVVTLVPTEPLETQRDLLLVSLAFAVLGILLLLVLKNLQFKRLFVRPIVAFAEQMRALERGRFPENAPDNDERFEELADIRARFMAMSEAIQQREASLEQIGEQARAASRAKTVFLANMSHEIRTPMNAVLGLAQLLRRDALSQKQRALVDRIQAAGESLLSIINDILDISKIESGELSLDRRPFGLEALFTKLDELYGPQARQKGLRLRLERPSEDPGPLLGDPLRLEQILTNLLNNAIKFTDEGEVSLRLRVLQVEAERVRLRFEIQDSGIGIPAEKHAELFTPFFQVDHGDTRRFGGTGLGLSIVRRLTDLLDGQIGVQSAPERGSLFWLELVFERADRRSGDGLREGGVEQADRSGVAPILAGKVPDRRASIEDRPQPRLQGLRLLAVDDSETNRFLLQELLEREGARVTSVGDGEQALVLLRGAPTAYAAVLMDLQMPVMDGLTATRVIRAEPELAAVPIIAVTAAAMLSQRESALAAGADAVLIKPIDLEDMVRAVMRITGREAPRVPDATRAARDAPSFPVIPGIDPDLAAQRLDGDPALLISLLTSFCDEHGLAVAQVREALASNDRALAVRRLHSLRGAAAQLGVDAVPALAESLESRIADGQQPEQAELDRLEERLAALLAESAPLRKNPTTRRTEPSGVEMDPVLLDALVRALRERDLRAIEHFDAIEAQLDERIGHELTAKVRSCIRALDFNRALAELSPFLRVQIDNQYQR